MFKGSFVALVTPFKNGAVDFGKIEELVQFHIDSGTDGLVPVGTTGESPTVSHDENIKIIECVIKAAGGKLPVIAGAGSNCTDEAISLASRAKKAGADATLQVCPYYNKPMQEGFYQHFKTIAEKVDLPVVLYNIPARCGGTGLAAETVARLYELDNIVAIKEATGSLDMASNIASICDIVILSGDDSLTVPLASIGARGVISVVANLVPKDVKAMTTALLAEDFVAARQWHYKLFELCKSMLTMATNPIPVKEAMAMLGIISDEIRLPMTNLDQSQKEKLRLILSNYGLL